MTGSLGRLEPLEPRQVWPHEARDFTPWLLDNDDALADVLGIDMELSAAEHPVGGYSLDLLGSDLTNNCVLMVENQLTQTDHGHLGQILTYAAGTEAKTVIWMATSFREEHRQALDFLNDLAAGEARFFGVEITVVRIGESEPAPLFRLRAQPNDWHSQVSTAARTTAQQAGKGPLYRSFWALFLKRVAASRPRWTRATKPQVTNWLSLPSPFKGLSYYSVSFAQGGKLRSELYLDYQDADEVVRVYERLLAKKELIENVYGRPLSWEDLPGRRACRICDYAPGDVTQEDEYDQYIEWFIDAQDRLRKAIDASRDSGNSPSV